MGPIAIVSISVAVLLIVLLVVFYTWVLRRNRSRGRPGVVSGSRLTCPKCGQSFDYDYIPGASLTSVRLGTSRYMACPLCHKWSVFDLRTPSPVDPPPH